MQVPSLGRRRFLAGGLAVAATVAIEACGGDSSSSSSTAAVPSSSAADSTTTSPPTTAASTTQATTATTAATATTEATTTFAPIAGAETVKAVTAVVDGIPELSLMSLGLNATARAGVTTLKGDGPVTVFAPSNEAVIATLQALDALGMHPMKVTDVIELVNYSVIDGAHTAADLAALDGQDVATRHGATVKITGSAGALKVNGASVVRADIDASGNIVHIVDQTLLPPTVPSETPTPTAAPGSTLADVIASNPDLSMFVDAAKSFGVWDVVVAADRFTIFAPTNGAFVALDADLEGANRMVASTAEANNILMTHILPDQVSASALAGRGSLTMLNGATVQVTQAGGTVKLDSASVVTPDVGASNGVLHLIDHVLVPAQS